MMKLALQSDDEIRAIIEPMIDRMLEGSTQRDHAAHVQDFTARLKVIVTEENLARQCESYQDDEFVLEAMFVMHDGRLQIEHCMIF